MKELKRVSYRSINRLAVPAILTGISEPVISLVDLAFIGRLGTTQIAAVGIASGFYLMMIWILAQSLTAIAAIVSQFYGKEELYKVETLIPQALISNILLGSIFFGLTNFFSAEIFSLYKAEGEVLAACVEYYSIRSVGFPFSLAAMLLFGVFRGLQNTSWAMVIALTGATLNILLDYILIFGVEGLIEAYGLRGAAAASLAAQITMFIMALVYFIVKTPFKLRFSPTLNPNFKWLVGMSTDLFVRTILLNLTFYLATRYATGYGKEVVAAHTIALNIWLFSSFFIDGYAHAGNAMSGRLIGGNKLEPLYDLGIKIGKVSLATGCLLAIIYALFYHRTATLFTADSAVVGYFTGVYWLVILSQPINALAFAFDGIYKGLGKTRFLRNLLIGATLLGFVPFAVGSHYLYGSLLGIWLAFTIWMIIRAAWLVFDFRKNYLPK